jgi:hypothetical protein
LGTGLTVGLGQLFARAQHPHGPRRHRCLGRLSARREPAPFPICKRGGNPAPCACRTLRECSATGTTSGPPFTTPKPRPPRAPSADYKIAREQPRARARALGSQLGSHWRLACTRQVCPTSAPWPRVRVKRVAPYVARPCKSNGGGVRALVGSTLYSRGSRTSRTAVCNQKVKCGTPKDQGRAC